MKGQKLPDTTLSRSIIIEMRRKKAGEKVAHFRTIDDAGLAELRRQALRWANDNGEKLKHAEPEMPVGFDNRLGDNWHLLLAIADCRWRRMAGTGAQGGDRSCRRLPTRPRPARELLADIRGDRSARS